MIRVLHVGDRVEFLKTTKESLSTYGIEVRSCSDPTKALNELDKERYHVIISDHQMAGMSGPALLREVRERGNDVPFVLFDDRDGEDATLDSLRIGADFHLTKKGDQASQLARLAEVIKALAERRYVRNRLVESEARFRRLTENLPAVVTKAPISPADRPYISPGVKNVLGYSHEEVVENPERFLNGELQRSFKDAMLRIRNGEDIQPIIHVTVEDKYGQLRWIEQRQVLVRDEEGRPHAIEAIAFDVTDAKKLADQNAYLSSILFEGLNETYLLNYDTYECEYANRKALERHGLDADDIHDVLSVFGEQYSTEKMERFVEDLRTGKKDMVASEISLTDKEGDPKTFEVHVQITRPLGERKFLMTVMDIDRVRRAEQELHRKEVLLHEYLDLTPISIVVLNGSGGIEYINDSAARIAGMSKERIYSLNMLDIIPMVVDPKCYIKPLDLSQNGYDSTEVVIRSSTGVRNLIVSMSRVDDGTFIGFGADVTEMKRVEQNLQHMNEKNQLLSSITRHDIMNQVAIIRGNLELLIMMGNLPEDRSGAITRAIEKIGQYVKFANSYSRAGMMEPVWFDIKDIADRSWRTIGRGGTEFVLDVQDIEVMADPLFPKVFDNLIVNSLLYAAGMTHITITFQIRGEDLMLIYSDDGTGIPDDLRPRLFTKGAGRNTGLGLFLIKQILEATGMTIAERGEGGKGARFEIAVPANNWRLRIPQD